MGPKIRELPSPKAHRHKPLSVQRTVVSGTGVQAETTIASLTFTPETAPFRMVLFFDARISGADNDLSGQVAGTLRLKRDGLTLFSTFVDVDASGTGARDYFSQVRQDRRTTTAPVTYSWTLEELENGVPRDTLDMTGEFSLDPTYEVGV